MRVHKHIYSIILILALCITSFIQEFVYADTTGRDISNSAVTGLTVSSDSILDGDTIRVDLKFDEKNENIQSGDFIKVTWPTSTNNTVFFEGFTKTFNLEVQGIVVGEAKITTSDAILTFNEKINNLNNVEGSAYFEMRGRNLSQQTTADTQTIAIQAGIHTVDVSITKPESGTGSTFYYKTGDMQPNDTDRVRWFLLINNTRSEVGNEIRIEDEIQSGQVLDPSTFYIYTQGTEVGQFYGVNAIQDFKQKFTDSDITYDVDKNTISVRIGKQDAKTTSFSIMYYTNIINHSQSMFENKTKAWFHEIGQAKVEGESFDYTVKNISAGADITGTVPGELKIYKVVEGTKTPIEGVQFQLKRQDGNIIKDGKHEIILTTNAEGIANIKDLSVGSYIVKEYHSVDWVNFDPITAPTYTFEVKITDTEGSFFEVENTIKTRDISVKKEWVGSEKDQIEIELYANGTHVDTMTLKKDSDWKGIFKDKPIYDAVNKKEIIYTVKEKDVAGYTSLVAGNQEDGFVIVNTIYGEVSFNVTKQWVGKQGTTANIKLYADDIYVQTVELNEANHWMYTFKGLDQYKDGKEIVYTVKEEVQAGYESKITGDVNSGFVVTNTNIEKISIPVTKKWIGPEAEQAEVTLYANGIEKQTITLTKDNNWTYTFDKLLKYDRDTNKEIEYTITEKEIEGYQSKVTGDMRKGFMITNTNVEEISIPVKKEWVGPKKEQVEVILYADGIEKETVTLNEENQWESTFTHLLKYDQTTGKEIEYTVKEKEIEGYTSMITGNQQDGFVVTNTIQRKISIRIRMEWYGGIREKITLNLYADGVKIDTVDIYEGDDLDVVFENLDVYKDGKEINYTLSQESIDGYESIITGSISDGFVITNTKKNDAEDIKPDEIIDQPVDDESNQESNEDQIDSIIEGEQEDQSTHEDTEDLQSVQENNTEQIEDKENGSITNDEVKDNGNIDEINTSDTTKYGYYVSILVVSMLLISYLVLYKYHKKSH